MSLRVLICIALGSSVLSAAVPLRLHAAQAGTVVSWGAQVLPLVEPTTRYKAIACGDGHNLAVSRQDTVVAWGGNYYGQSTVPSGLSEAVTVAAGINHSVALKSNGTVVAWGGNA